MAIDLRSHDHPREHPGRDAAATPLLAAKFYIPAARPGLVPRPRLLALLDGGLSARLTLLSALPGSGKTTLAGLGRPLKWLAASYEMYSAAH